MLLYYIHSLQNVSEIIYDDWQITGSIDLTKSMPGYDKWSKVNISAWNT